MKALALRRISVLTEKGSPDPGSRIDPGDLCEIGQANHRGLYPVTYPTPRGKKTRFLAALSGFTLRQRDYAAIAYPAPGYPAATVKSGGCGVCAAGMILGALCGKAVPVSELARFSMSCGARVSGGTDMRRLSEALCAHYGLVCRMTGDVNALKRHLRSGGCAVCNAAGNGIFSTGGHYIVALGELNGRVCIADPGIYSGKYASGARKAAVTVCGELLLADYAVVDGDCMGRTPRYYLFSRA